MEKVQWGVIGLGFFGEKHAEVLSSLPDAHLAAVCTRRPERLREIGERFGVSNRYTDYKELLEDKDIDTVSVVTHVQDHCDIAVEALEAGKHVFLEKPMAGTVEECDRIVRAAHDAPGKFMVGHICRFDPRVILAKKAVAEGRIGRILSMHARRNLPAFIGAEVLDKISPLLGDGVHDTDIMLWLAESRIESVFARTVQVRNFRNPDIGWALFGFESGAVGVIETVWHLPEKSPFAIDARMEVIGTEGALYIDCGNGGLSIHDAMGVSMPDTVYWPAVNNARDGALRRELEYFTACVRKNTVPDVITPEESREAVKAVCAAEESAAQRKIVFL